LIDMDPETGLSRAKGRQGTEERFEDFGPELQRRMRAGFLALAAEFPARFRVIDGARPVEVVAAEVLATVRTALGGRADG
ncbi:MAG: thymidylate kinase, partial [Rhodobacteraceae bacterium]|nr:thymidylate kinase [Paracoccaceae bacterium]